MSNQRRMRAELKQGLHQFLMSLYGSYTQSLGHEDAVQQIAACLEEEYKYFTKQAVQQEQSLDLETYIRRIEALAKKEKSPVKQHEIYEDAEALLKVQEILAKYDLTEDKV